MICGKPVVCHLLDRAFDSKYLGNENVVVCTTREPSDDTLVEMVESYGARVFRGSTDDIIRRFYDAMNQFGFDYVIQINGDNITAEPRYMDLTMEKLLSDRELDIVTCRNLPLGIASLSFSRKAMEKVYGIYRTVKNDTGFIYYFTKTDICNQAVIDPVNEGHIFDRIRLTLDYEEDFEFFKAIFEELYQEGEVFHLDDILDLVRRKPEIVNINYFREEEYWHRTAQKVDLAYDSGDGTIKKISL